ncbi:MAG: deoxyribonuclease IV [bacterium]|nr:deoxyribonuclease IV [bacterium]MDT8365251.1 deoxyribonuclease IV [bacterium]
MLIGAHESISGSFEKSIHRAVEDECECFQIFTGPPGRWKVPPVDPNTTQAFKEALAANGDLPIVVHGAYLINPASPDPDLWIRSLVALKEEYTRCMALGIGQLIIHPGSHKDTSVEDGLRRAAEMVQAVLEENVAGPDILLENTAGSGSSVGCSFSQLAAIRELAGFPDRVRFCFDTAHAFAAGYDMRDRKKVKSALTRIDGEAGLDNIRVVHLNDSMKELGSRVDRHERIGEGHIGKNGFRVILSEEVFTNVPGILETQPLPDGDGRYRPQVQLLKKLAGGAA